MSIKTIGIDLGQTACDVVARDGHGKVVRRRRLSRQLADGSSAAMISGLDRMRTPGLVSFNVVVARRQTDDRQ